MNSVDYKFPSEFCFNLAARNNIKPKQVTMKKQIAIVTGLLLTLAVQAQKIKDADVPATVKTAFSTRYPNTKVLEWEKEGANYEAEFKTGKTESSAVFDATGTFIESETEISPAGLPKAVSEYVTKNMPGKKISEASKITTAAGKVTYEAEVGDSDYLFDEQGNFIGKETGDDAD